MAGLQFDLLFYLFGFSCFAFVEWTKALLFRSNPNQSNRRSAVKWYFSLWNRLVLSGEFLSEDRKSRIEREREREREEWSSSRSVLMRNWFQINLGRFVIGSKALAPIIRNLQSCKRVPQIVNCQQRSVATIRWSGARSINLFTAKEFSHN